MAEPLFDLDNVSYRYQRIDALKDLTLRIPEGRRVALLGANGCGKSTLLRILDGLAFPVAGSTRFRGEALTEERLQDSEFALNFRRKVGLVFQDADVQLFNPTVFDEVAFGPLQLRWPAAEIQQRVEQALQSMGVAHLRDRAPHRLSGGEKKRVAIASVLVLGPEVLLLDEPTATLDPRSQSQVIDLLSGWNHSNRTVITATQDIHIVEDIADHCYVLEEGRLAAAGTPQEIFRDTALLQRTNLIHAHRHTHDGVTHTHPHRHGHQEHEH